MTDIEITGLCAEAMGYEIVDDWRDGQSIAKIPRAVGGMGFTRKYWTTYAPLHNDAQMVALVKQFEITIEMTQDEWCVAIRGQGYLVSRDLNRAICECVAKMQAAK